VILVVGALYFARVVFLPLALSVLLAFLLGPLVTRLRHWGFGRAPAAIIVVLFSFVLVAVIASFVTAQTADLAHRLPEYEQNIRHKFQSLRDSGGGIISRVNRIARNVSEELTPAPPPTKSQPGEEKPVPVEIRRPSFSPFEVLRGVIGSVLNLVLTASIVVVFVIFMLI